MNERPELLQVVGEWVETAEGDYRNASNTLATMGDDCPYATACFHAQQCAEKYVKAILVLQSIGFPFIHDVARLLTLLPSEISVALSVPGAVGLTRYATATRYPGAGLAVTRTEAEDALKVAEQIRIGARAHLPPECLHR